MKRLFLTSSIDEVASHVAKKIDKKGLKLIFIKTASETESDLSWLEKDREALVKAGFKVTDYTLTGKTRADIEKTLKNTDVIFFSGGNTFYLLQRIQETKSADVIRKFVENGKIYIGSSAGSIVAGPDIYPSYRIDNVKKAPNLKGYIGLGLIDVVVLPHWGSNHFKKLYMKTRLKHIYNTDYKLILLNDYQYLEVKDNIYHIEEISH